MYAAPDISGIYASPERERKTNGASHSQLDSKRPMKAPFAAGQTGYPALSRLNFKRPTALILNFSEVLVRLCTAERMPLHNRNTQSSERLTFHFLTCTCSFVLSLPLDLILPLSLRRSTTYDENKWPPSDQWRVIAESSPNGGRVRIGAAAVPPLVPHRPHLRSSPRGVRETS